MPPLVRCYVKTSFVFLVLGLLLGGYIIVREFLFLRPSPRLFITAHVHLLLVGFVLMIVMGVATWMFPRPARDDARYRPELAKAVYWVMMPATALRAASEVLAGVVNEALAGGSPPLGLYSLIVVGGLGQLLGAVLFVVNMWWRVRMSAVLPPLAR